MRNAKVRSIARAKKSFFKMSEVLGKRGSTALLPGGGLAFEVITTLVKHAKQFYQDRTEARLHEFHESLLGSGSNDVDPREFLDKPISVEDYYALLSAAIQDNEQLKVPLYANILRSLAAGRIPSKYKVHLLKVAREITYDEAEFIRRVCVYSRHDIISPGGGSEQLSCLFRTESAMQTAMLQNLSRFGFLRQKAEDKYEPTDLLHLTVQAMYTQQDLQPASIGKEQWIGIRVLIVSYALEKHSNLAIRIQRLLVKYQIKSAIATLTPNNVAKVNLFNHALIFLLDSMAIPDNYRKAVGRIHPSKVIIKVLLPDQDGSQPRDSLPELRADEVLRLKGNSPKDLEELENMMGRYLKALG